MSPFVCPLPKPFSKLLQVLLQDPALRLSELNLYPSLVTEKEGYALRVCVINLGFSFALMAYLPRKIRPCYLRMGTLSASL